MSATKGKIKELKFHINFIISEVDKAIELADQNKVLITKLKKIKELLQ
jgi:hypothetical protein